MCTDGTVSRGNMLFFCMYLPRSLCLRHRGIRAELTSPLPSRLVADLNHRCVVLVCLSFPTMPYGSLQKRNYQQIPSGTEPAPGISANAVLLVTTSLITIGSHYNKHSLSSLGPAIIDALGLHRTKYGLLFSSQAIPGIVLPVISGLALSCLPYGPAAITLSALIMFSTVLCATAVTYLSYNMLVVGRFVFGLCDGALTTLQGAIIARYFRSRCGIGFGTMLLVSRLASFTGLTLPAYILDVYGLNISMWFSFLLCIPPFLATVAYTRFTTNSVVPPTTPSVHLLVSTLRRLTWPFWLVAYDWLVVASVVFTLLHFAPDARNNFV